MRSRTKERRKNEVKQKEDTQKTAMKKKDKET